MAGIGGFLVGYTHWKYYILPGVYNNARIREEDLGRVVPLPHARLKGVVPPAQGANMKSVGGSST
ncbi:hypothetical protein B6U83_03840 [Thermoplasmatales archaeon ex4484_36]|nr:MAG: hypothetical protein B6U83_03840 [Thermoplasmatales archaeon ex4484_36]